MVHRRLIEIITVVVASARTLLVLLRMLIGAAHRKLRIVAVVYITVVVNSDYLN